MKRLLGVLCRFVTDLDGSVLTDDGLTAMDLLYKLSNAARCHGYLYPSGFSISPYAFRPGPRSVKPWWWSVCAGRP